jgi:hypothetical protein
MTIGGGYIDIYKWEWVRPPAVDPTRIRARSDGGLRSWRLLVGEGEGRVGLGWSEGMVGRKGR